MALGTAEGRLAYLRALRASKPQPKQFDPQELVQQLGNLQQQAAVREYQKQQIAGQQATARQRAAEFAYQQQQDQRTGARADRQLDLQQEAHDLKMQEAQKQRGLESVKADLDRLRAGGEIPAPHVGTGPAPAPAPAPEVDPYAPEFQEGDLDRQQYATGLEAQLEEQLVAQYMQQFPKSDPSAARDIVRQQMELSAAEARTKAHSELKKQQEYQQFNDEAKRRTLQNRKLSNELKEQANILSGGGKSGRLMQDATEAVLDKWGKKSDEELERFARSRGFLTRGKKYSRDTILRAVQASLLTYGTYGKNRAKTSLPNYVATVDFDESGNPNEKGLQRLESLIGAMEAQVNTITPASNAKSLKTIKYNLRKDLGTGLLGYEGIAKARHVLMHGDVSPGKVESTFKQLKAQFLGGDFLDSGDKDRLKAMDLQAFQSNVDFAKHMMIKYISGAAFSAQELAGYMKIFANSDIKDKDLLKTMLEENEAMFDSMIGDQLDYAESQGEDVRTFRARYNKIKAGKVTTSRGEARRSTKPKPKSQPVGEYSSSDDDWKDAQQ